MIQAFCFSFLLFLSSKNYIDLIYLSRFLIYKCLSLLFSFWFDESYVFSYFLIILPIVFLKNCIPFCIIYAYFGFLFIFAFLIFLFHFGTFPKDFFIKAEVIFLQHLEYIAHI